MLLNIEGKLNNTALKETHSLLPLFEAIINSFQAIADNKTSDGKIEIVIKRDDLKGLNGTDKGDAVWPIRSISVIDNGIGFNSENYDSFNTSDTLYKKSLGGKGVGRFLWLKAFGSVSIESTYKEKNEWFKRSFNFIPRGDGIDNHRNIKIEKGEFKTTITLQDLSDKYQKYYPKTIDDFAIQIIEHCLICFLAPTCPQVLLRDADEHLNLNEKLEHVILSRTAKEDFFVKQYKFHILHLALSQAKSHEVYYLANDRSVSSAKIQKMIPNVPFKMERNGMPFFYLGIVYADYLDENVNNERVDFALKKEEDLISGDELSWTDIETAVKDMIKQKLSEYIAETEERKIKRVKEFVEKEAPYYRAVLKHKSDKLEVLPYEEVQSDTKLDLALHKLQNELEVESKEKSLAIIQELRQSQNCDDYDRVKEKFNKFLEVENDLGKSSLAKYVIHRKVVLELFDEYLQHRENGKYHLEDAIHKLIFPMRTTSADIDYEEQNLWLIDEKLCFHKYLASDMRINTMAPVSSESEERPDLVIFNDNTPKAYVDSDGPSYDSITLIEFKRPGRTGYTEDDKAIVQVYEYMDLIKKGLAKKENGQQIIPGVSVRFYGYIVCDLTQKVKTDAEIAGFSPTSDNSGYYTYNPTYKAYVEIISYQKLLNDAQKRNKILFKKLSLQ